MDSTAAKQSVKKHRYARFKRNASDFSITSEPPKDRYPKQIFPYLGFEFFERFCNYGIGAILVLYMNENLGYSENDASALYHAFSMCTYLFCISGGIISDVWLGKFKAMLYFSMIYALGCAIISMSAFPIIGISPKIVLIIGMILLAFGSGNIKPPMAAFAGDQFKLPEQAVQLTTFFSVTYFLANFSSIISMAISPILRTDVHCFGENDCYPLAFGIPTFMMVVAIAFLMVGKSSFIIVEVSSKNVVVEVTKCIWNAIKAKIRKGMRSPHKNLLDYSIDKYGVELVDDIRTLLRILILYMPLPIFWTLNAQSGSRWIFQGKQMNGDIGFYVIRSDQMQLVSPILVLIMVPLFETVVYPLLRRFGLGKPLQKMVIGGILMSISFVFSAIVQFQIESTPKNTVHMLWQLPQYIVICAGEILFTTVGLQFCYSEAPKNMKTIVGSFWSLTMAIGNLITLVFVSSIHIFENQSHEILFFAGLMLFDILIFGILAYFYKSSVHSDKELV